METGTLIAIVIAALVLIAVLVLISRAAKNRQLEARRTEAVELRQEAQDRGLTAERHSAVAEEKAAIADQAEAEARQQAAVAKREREEVEQFVEERADGGQLTALLQGGHQLPPHIGGALQRGAPAIAEGLDAQGFLFPGGRVEERLE